MRKILISVIILILIFLPVQADPPRVGSPLRVEAGFLDDLPELEITGTWYEKIVSFFNKIKEKLEDLLKQKLEQKLENIKNKILEVIF